MAKSVTIDGVNYYPGQVRKDIGIAITTTGTRPQALEASLKNHAAYRPQASVMVVVVDGPSDESLEKSLSSAIPDLVVVFTGARTGIPNAKNECLRQLQSQGVEHYFLFDDDAWPIRNDWADFYVSSGQNHLSYQFKDIKGPHKLGDIQVIYNDGKIVGYSGQRGVMLYYTAEAIEKCGGFDMAYGKGMYEHGDLAMRIYAAGLTSTPFGDVAQRDLFYSLDENLAVERSIPDAEREKLDERNRKMYTGRVATFMKTGDWPVIQAQLKPGKGRLYISTLISTIADPQRNGVSVGFEGAVQWAKSIKERDTGSDVIILSDEADKVLRAYPNISCDVIQIDLAWKHASLYMQRWEMVRRYLLSVAGKYESIFITDCTDVTLLVAPSLGDEDAGSLFVGDEPDVLGSQWMVANHGSPECVQMFVAERDSQLYNAGIVGGNAIHVMDFLARMTHIIQRRETDAVHGRPQVVESFDMGIFNYVARAMARSGTKIVSGPRVNTVFKSFGKFGSKTAWFMHK